MKAVNLRPAGAEGVGRPEYKTPHCSDPGDLIDITSLTSKVSGISSMESIVSLIFLVFNKFIFIFHCRNNAR